MPCRAVLCCAVLQVLPVLQACLVCLVVLAVTALWVQWACPAHQVRHEILMMTDG
jgi:hypothetical protein